MLFDLKVKEFLGELASDKPAPGGGSVAALAGALSASLVAMVGRVSGKAENQNRIQEIIKTGDSLATELQDLIEKDTQAFNKVMSAYKMPKTTEEEKTARSQAIQMAMKEAALTPLKVMELSVKTMEIASEIARLGNQNAITDAGVAGLMGRAAVKGAAYNVQINLLSIKDEDFKRDLGNRLNQLNIKAEELSKVIEDTVEKGIGV